MTTPRTTHSNLLPQAAVLALSAIFFPFQASAGYSQTNLVSDIPGLAKTTDPNLVNPWGISSSPTSPFWVSDNGTGVSTLYNTAGTPQSLVVSIPGGKPTGQVFNGSSNFVVTDGTSGPSRFIFASENGTISGWNPAVPSPPSTTAIIGVDNSASGAIYKGIAINSAQDTLFAANFGNPTLTNTPGLEKYGSTFNYLGTFTDPTVPTGFAPFNAQNIGGTIYVTFAKQAGTGDDAPGAGNGFVDKFNPATNTFTRLISNGPLDSPWGIALAPSNFGEFSNDLLVGNFGNGRINAFDPVNGAQLGTLTDGSGNPIVIDGLWGLQFGNGGNGGAADKLYFTAGIADPSDPLSKIEDHGLFGSLSAVPEPGSLSLAAIGLAGLGWSRLKRDQKA